MVTVVGRDQLTDLPDGRAGIGIEEPELDAELIAGERQHPSELPAAEYSDFHSRAAGSG